MAKRRLVVRKLREILRQKLLLQRSHRQIARSVEVSLGKVGGVSRKAVKLRLDWSQVEELSDEQLQEQLYGARRVGHRERTLPEMASVHTELRRVGVTLWLLHQEYRQEHKDGYGYATFCRRYREWRDAQQPVMRQTHKAGDKAFVDYSGKKPCIVNQSTGEVIEVELFVAVLGASNYTYAEATLTQKVHDFIGSHIRAMAYFGGTPRALVPDQLKSAVTRPCRYEPLVQRTYEAMAAHYGTTVLPARPKKPRDKAKVEGAVLIVQRWILARIRNQTFFSLAELNERIRELLDELNREEMKEYGASRRELFEKLDRPVLEPLPRDPFTVGEWQEVRVDMDYHVSFDHHHYSVSYLLANEKADIHVTSTVVEVYHNGARVALHPRSYERGGKTTQKDHMPVAHQRHAQWTPSRLVRWAESIGFHTGKLVMAILEEQRHPERGYRSCLGLLRLSKRYDPERLEAACARAIKVGAYSYRHVESVLKHGLDRVPLAEPVEGPKQEWAIHEHVRGADYYNANEGVPLQATVSDSRAQEQEQEGWGIHMSPLSTSVLQTRDILSGLSSSGPLSDGADDSKKEDEGGGNGTLLH